ncbi:MAG TPA: ROK family protein [Bdellovibrionales bacterium]|nr:ROK family protein [Bdellovibrionales bacterium]
MARAKTKARTKSYTVGIDLGGTKVAAALVDAQGKIITECVKPTVPPWMSESDLRSSSAPSPADVKKHVSYVVSAMAEAAMDCIERGTMKLGSKPKLIGVGLASAGPMNIEKGALDFPSNFKGWGKVPLVALLERALAKHGLKARVHFQNDAIAAALGEGWIGVAKGKSTYASITVGTGIGTGVIFNGKPAQSRGMGSEWGHMICDFKNFGSDEGPITHEVEGIASGTGLARRAKVRGLSQETAAELATAARNGNEDAKALFDDAAAALASLFYSLSLGFNPEVFAISGGMIAIQDLFLPKAIALYENAIQRHPAFGSKIRVSRLGTKAGVVGAARLPLI